MEMNKEQFKAVLDNFKWSVTVSCMDAGDLEDILNLVHDIFEAEADAMKEKCPWASRSIEKYETIAREISFVQSDILNLFEQVKEG